MDRAVPAQGRSRGPRRAAGGMHAGFLNDQARVRRLSRLFSAPCLPGGLLPVGHVAGDRGARGDRGHLGRRQPRGRGGGRRGQGHHPAAGRRVPREHARALRLRGRRVLRELPQEHRHGRMGRAQLRPARPCGPRPHRVPGRKTLHLGRRRHGGRAYRGAGGALPHAPGMARRVGRKRLYRGELLRHGPLHPAHRPFARGGDRGP